MTTAGATPAGTRLPEAITGDPALRRVLAALAPARALIVGGAVRNALLGEPVSDIDIATDARPELVMERAAAAGLKPVPTGIDHGTVTVVADGRGFEVTSFRRDVATDGRRAEVAFSDRLEDDASRRDFTINALYADAEGKVIDPVGGLPDLAARRLRFVGDPDQRIAEDYLRILRFFRFHAWYGRRGGADPAALAACARHAAGLSRISRERIGAEMRKLLSAPGPVEAVALMQTAGVLAQLLPGADAAGLTALEAVLDGAAGPGRCPRAAAAAFLPENSPQDCFPGARKPRDISGQKMDWQLRLAALGAEDAAGALRLSRAEARVQEELRSALPLDEAAYRLGEARAVQLALLRASRGEGLRADWREQIGFAAAQVLPISAADLAGRLSGPALGRGLKAAEAAWIGSGFRLPVAALVDVALQAGDGT
ncbi:MAG TPA: CCA tRNA nucleotidyltransferase [Paracoccus solventivorans]|uniref:CCA tRNA nucleotidyltransferase n=1 Tax=Paracoccus solventivorans TaxID=53463 RepID=A0A832QYC5_9RHOB|nr:CCA tRNA nucleotidyltransferase [Paracoccus solventivorans]HHW34188.1 CCA tRNA nucleotidyltransferase [Paracoccus solventivorans]